ncbi:MAG: hypothetical protein R3B96_12995 [Pirellulaceae bacterium]
MVAFDEVSEFGSTTDRLDADRSRPREQVDDQPLGNPASDEVEHRLASGVFHWACADIAAVADLSPAKIAPTMRISVSSIFG